MIQVTRCEGVCGDNHECAAVKVEVSVKTKLLLCFAIKSILGFIMYVLLDCDMYLGPSKASQVNDQVISNRRRRASQRTGQGSCHGGSS